MNITPIERTRLEDVALEDREKASSVHAPNPAKAALTLEQKLPQDLLKDLSVRATNQTVENTTFFSSLWNSICFWKQPEKDVSTQVSPADLRAVQERAIPEKISHVPKLEAPDMIPADLQAAKFPLNPKKASGKSLLTLTEICEGLALMSEHSIESIMFIIFKAQLELEKDNANVIEGTYAKYMQFQKLQQAMLQEMKDILAKDEKVAGYFQTGQNILLAASYLAGVAALATMWGIDASIAGFISAGYGPVAGQMFLAAVQGFPIVCGGLLGLATITKTYFKRKLNEHQAGQEEFAHLDRYYDHHVDYSRDRLMSTAEAATSFQDRWLQLLKRNDKMRKMVFRK